MTIRQADDYQLKHGTDSGRKFNVDDIYKQLAQHIDAKIAADTHKKEYERNPVSIRMEKTKLTSTSMRAGPLARRMRLRLATHRQRVVNTFLE